MRLFVAVRIDPAVVARIAAFSAGLDQLIEERAPAARVSWVKEEQLHVTVRFIGHVDDSRAAAIRAVLVSPIPVPPFVIEAGGSGAFPPRGAPRVFWAGLTAGTDALAAVEAEVSSRLDGCGITREDRPYRPHITLARVREAAGLRAGIVAGLAAEPFGSWRVDTITLFESRPSPQGHQYLPICETPLQS